MPRTQEVTANLGCGTLILIAVIVMIFGGRENHDQLENRIEELSIKIQGLRQDIHSLKNNLPSPAPAPPQPVLPERESP